MGDPAGVGPEIIVKACRRLKPRIDAGEIKILAIGSVPALRAAEALLGAPPIPETRIDDAWPALACLQAGREGAPIRFGELSADGGRFAS